MSTLHLLLKATELPQDKIQSDEPMILTTNVTSNLIKNESQISIKNNSKSS